MGIENQVPRYKENDIVMLTNSMHNIIEKDLNRALSNEWKIVRVKDGPCYDIRCSTGYAHSLHESKIAGRIRSDVTIEETQSFEMAEDIKGEAKRDPVGVRFDLIPGECLELISKVFAHGAAKYGEYNWQQSRMTGENGPINHALKHLNYYNAGIPDDEGDDPMIHLSHAAVNIIFEMWYHMQEQPGGKFHD